MFWFFLSMMRTMHHLRRFTLGIFFLLVCAIVFVQIDLRLQTRTLTLIEASDSDLRLAHYAAAHRLDPLFVIEGTNPEEFRTAAHSLREAERKIADAYPQDSRTMIENGLRSWSFLEALAASEVARDAFLEFPTREGAVNFHRALVETMTLYQVEAGAAAQSIDSVPPAQIVFWAGSTSPAHTAHVLRTARALVETALETENNRFECLSRWWYPCPHIQIKHTEPVPLPEDLSVPQAVRGFAEAVDGYLRITTSDRAPLALNGSTTAPLIRLTHTACLPKSGGAWFKIWAMKTSDGTPLIKAANLDDPYFFDYSLRTSPINLMRDAGITLEYQPFNPYICADYDTDVGTLLSAYDIYKRIHARPLTDTIQNPELKEIRSAEKHIAKSAVVDARAIDAYIAAISRALESYGERSIEKMTSRAIVLELEERRRVWMSKGSGLDYRIGALEQITPYTLLLIKENRLPWPVYAIGRGFYSTLFQLGNETVIANTLSTLPSRDTNSFSQFPLRPYNGDVERTLPLSMIPEFMLQTLQRSEKVLLRELQ